MIEFLPRLSLICLCGWLAGSLQAQSGFSYGEEFRYPTTYKVKRSGGTGNRGTGYPVVEPGDFVSRKTGASIDVKNITVRGTVRTGRAANGQEVAVLQPNGSGAFQVATGSTFRLGGHIMQARGWKDESTYVIVDLSEGKAYGFTRP